MATTMMLKDDGPERQRERHPFDLEERTAVFGENIVRFSKRIPRDPTNNRLIEMNFQDPTPSITQSRARSRKADQVAQALALFEVWNFYGAWMLVFGAL